MNSIWSCALFYLVILQIQTIAGFSSIQMSKIEGILFDVDGTLSDSFMLGFTATQEVLKKEGFPLITEETYHGGTVYTTPRRFAWHVTGNPDDNSGVGERLGKLFDEYYINLVSLKTAPLFNGVEDMLDLLKNDFPQIKLGALSNACGAYVDAVIQVNNLMDTFCVSKGADEVCEAKPKGGGLIECSRILGVEPSKCIYVGDSPTDGMAAAAADYHCSIGCTWGSHPESTVRPAFTHTVGSVDELTSILKSIVSGENLI